MTSKEAIEIIKSVYPPGTCSLLREALDLAIRVLEEDSKKEEWYRVVCNIDQPVETDTQDEVVEMVKNGEKRKVLRGTFAWKSYIDQGFVEKI